MTRMIPARQSACSAILLVLLAFASGCTVQYMVLDRKTGFPAEIVKSGWSNTGCVENLHETAAEFGVMVRLVRVEREFEGSLWGLFPSPYYPMYVCYGEVIPTVHEEFESSSPGSQTP